MVRFAFVHPDLGIGGAERAVIDIGLALQSDGHSVVYFTSHHNPNHSFPETNSGALKVVTAGDWLPRQLFGRFSALCAYIRMLYLALYIVIFNRSNIDNIFCDQISACIPVFRSFLSAKIIFYCHFPDLLLTRRDSFWKKLYRYPIDWLEEKTTGQADRVVVNSNFTKDIFRKTFTSLIHIEPVVLYPIPNYDALDGEKQEVVDFSGCDLTFLSLNRYERKKNINLAISSFAKACLDSPKKDLTMRLIIAGGYDNRVDENVEYFKELMNLVDSIDQDMKITFLKSPSDAEKRYLLTIASCLLYTPENEHFGIVPVEAMYMGLPVVACNSGGPLETVIHEETGFLCEPNVNAFAAAIRKFCNNRNLSKKLGDHCRKHVLTNFSYDVYRARINTLLVESLRESQ